MSTLEAQIPFRGSPIALEGGIPRFCDLDAYVGNYQRIAADHVRAMRPGASNPFIEDALWKVLEHSTQDILLRHLSPGSSILDVGVGLGRVLGPLRQYERYGVDISHDYLVQAQAAGIHVAFARAEQLPFEDGAFDAVVACDVLEHVFDLNAVCREMLRVLRPGGLLVVRVPSREDLSAYLADGLPYEFIHVRSFDLSGLRLLFGKVFGMQFVDGGEVGPYLQGSTRLRLRLLPEPVRARIAAMVRSLPTGPMGLPLKRVFETSEEAFEQWIYWLRDNHPTQFEALSPLLLLGIEVNAAFRKVSLAGNGSGSFSP
jgi:SAM-dependent methyltransferase